MNIFPGTSWHLYIALLFCKYNYKHITCISFFNSHNTPMMWVLLKPLLKVKENEVKIICAWFQLLAWDGTLPISSGFLAFSVHALLPL